MEFLAENWHFFLASLVTATVSGSIGVAGGILLLSYMAAFFTPAVLIPLHGIVQLSSNLSRVFLNFKAIDGSIAIAFSLGALAGGLIGSQVLVQLPEDQFRILLATFILVLTWLPKFKRPLRIPGKFFWLGGGISFLSLFMGAIGPLLAPFLIRNDLPKERLVVTQAACQATTHLIKIITYLALGFVVGPYVPLLVVMILFGFIGNWLGKQILNKIPTEKFNLVLKIVISLLAVRLLIQGLNL